MKFRQSIPFIILVLFASSSCSDQQSVPLTQQEQRVAKAYAEVLVLNERHRTNGMDDSLIYARSVDSVLARLGFEWREFEGEFLKLSQSPRKAKPLFDSTEAAIRELRRRQIEAQER
ncbi:MAG: hypothetical protein FJ215_10860 [Ignavibacteria bacterium]|nr:hypothetical protein [Ignavibacteria bacterium]